MKRAAEFKEKNATLFHNLLPIDEKFALLENNVVNVMTGRDHKGRRLLLVNSGKTWDPSRVSADQILRLFYLIHELAMLEPETQVGYLDIVIVDHVGFITPTICQYRARSELFDYTINHDQPEEKAGNFILESVIHS